MANHLIDETSITAIADAIRAKTGSTAKLKPGDMASAIEGIQTSAGGDTLTEFLRVRNGQYLFYYCSKITTIPEMDTSSVTDMTNMFYTCSKITTIPEMDTSSVTEMFGMFYNCQRLTTIPEMDTRNVTSMGSMFNTCRNLTTIPEMDTRNVTSMSNIISGCSSLTNITLKNIKTDLTVGSGTSYGHLLTLDSLTGLIYELRDTGASKTLTVGSANLEKLANVYVKTIDITDEMRAEDDLIDEKLPFVVCESTDEGATLITEYVVLKNWQLK